MTFSFLLILELTFFVKVVISTGAALTAQSATCVLGQVTPTDARPVEGLRVVCPQGTSLQQVGSKGQEDPRDPKVLTQAGGNSVSLRTLLPSATYEQVVEGSAIGNILKVSQLPGKSVGLYFECRHKYKADSCYVQINVLPAHRLGPNVCEVLGSRIDFAVHAENEKVVFRCGTGLMLLPADRNTVYDGNCNNIISLDTVLPDSYVYHASNDQPSVLVAKYLPPFPQCICFICAPLLKPTNEDHNCLVRVTTAARSGAAPLQKRTASGARGSEEHRIVRWGLLLFGTGYVTFC